MKVLEELGILTWVNRVKRALVIEPGVDMFGKANRRLRIFRTSNAYTFKDPNPRAAAQSSKSETQSGTPNQLLPLSCDVPKKADDPELQAALDRLQTSRRWMEERKSERR
jgi:hypothetical protein